MILWVQDSIKTQWDNCFAPHDTNCNQGVICQLAGRRIQDGFSLMSVNLVGMAGGLGSARTISYCNSSKAVSEYLDFLHGVSGHLEEVFLERGGRNCQKLAHCHFCHSILMKQPYSPDLRSRDVNFIS